MPDTTRTDIYSALHHAREEFPTITKDREAGGGRKVYKYADLTTILDAVTPVLTAQGLALFQRVAVEEGRAELETRLVLMGDTPEFLVSQIPLPENPTSQELGSAITYARRYAIVCLLGITTEDDDDGAVASGASSGVTKREDDRVRPEPIEPPAPSGWDSGEQARSAHLAIIERINSLPAEYQTGPKDYRAEHGWPLSVPEFNELDELVRVAEGFAPSV